MLFYVGGDLMRLRKLGNALYPLSLIVGMLLTNGCTVPANTTIQTEQTSSPETVHLRLVQSMVSPHRTEQLEQLIKQFESEHQNIRVELISPDYDTADDMILTMLEQKKEVDIVEVSAVTVNKFVSEGLIANLDPYTDKWINYQVINENARDLARDVNNTVYYIPSSLSQEQLFYRKDLFDAKALQAPETWEQLYFVGKQVTNPEEDQYGFAFRGGEGSSNQLAQIIRDYNGDNVNLNDSMFRWDGGTIFSIPAALDALKLYKKIYVELAPPESIDWSLNEQVQSFADGQTMMMIQDQNAIEQIEAVLEEGSWATAPLPTGPEGISHYTISASGWGIATHSEHQYEAWELIAFLSSIDNNDAFAQAAGVISVYSNVLDNEIYTSGPYAPFKLMNNMHNRYKPVKPPSNYVNYLDYYHQSPRSGRYYLQSALKAEELLSSLDQFWQAQKE